MYKKRGQATGAAILVAVIAVLIVLYILFLPPEERQQLLEEAEEEETGVTIYDLMNRTLLDEIPGRLDFIAEKEIEHSMPTINLNILAESRVIKEVDSVYVGKSWFGQEKVIINFSIDNPDDVEDMILNFKVRESKGRLKIAINGYKVFDSEIKTINIQPIKLIDYILKENSLEISVSSPGVAFWSTNHYVLEDVKVIGDILSREGQESRNVFILTSAEKNNLEKSWLKFWPECTINKVGRLTAWINSYEVYSAIPDCGMPVPAVEFAPYYLKTGENVLKFKTDLGNYLIDHIKIKTKLSQIEYPVYYFELNNERYNDIRAGNSKIYLEIRFVDTTEEKLGTVNINGHIRHLDLTEIRYLEEIDELIEAGSNSVKIEPRKTLDIAALKVMIEED